MSNEASITFYLNYNLALDENKVIPLWYLIWFIGCIFSNDTASLFIQSNHWIIAGVPSSCLWAPSTTRQLRVLNITQKQWRKGMGVERIWMIWCIGADGFRFISMEFESIFVALFPILASAFWRNSEDLNLQIKLVTLWTPQMKLRICAFKVFIF